jgi:hypothetical protein
MTGSAFSCGERTWMKWMSSPVDLGDEVRQRARASHDMCGDLADPSSACESLGSGGSDRSHPVRVADRVMHVRAEPIGGGQRVLVGHGPRQLPDLRVGGGQPGRAKQPDVGERGGRQEHAAFRPDPLTTASTTNSTPSGTSGTRDLVTTLPAASRRWVVWASAAETVIECRRPVGRCGVHHRPTRTTAPTSMDEIFGRGKGSPGASRPRESDPGNSRDLSFVVLTN